MYNIDRCCMCSGKEYLFYQNIYKHTLAQVCQAISSLTDFCFLIVWNMDSAMFDLLFNKFTVIFKWLFHFQNELYSDIQYSWWLYCSVCGVCSWLFFGGLFPQMFCNYSWRAFLHRSFICRNSGIPKLWKLFFKVFSFSICFFQIPL